MARRRRTRYTWLPNTGSAGPAADTGDTTNGRDFGLINVPINGTTDLVFVDLLNDDATEEQTVGPIGPIINSEYVIKRIVGKFFIGVEQGAGTDIVPAVLVGAGIFVARANDIDTSGGLFQPIGAVNTASGVDNYSPLRQETIREPWIWRRTWVLSNQLQTAAANSVNRVFPRSTAEYGSVMDGPHIDAKTGRRVGQDDRLWAVVAARNFPLNTTNDTVTGVRAFIDYRVLGAGRRAKARSAF